jgi:hypothetical protein
MATRKCAAQRRMCKVRLIYDQLPPSAQRTLCRAAYLLSQSKHPPRIWIRCDR